MTIVDGSGRERNDLDRGIGFVSLIWRQVVSAGYIYVLNINIYSLVELISKSKRVR